MANKFIVIDTETTNSIDDPICYDIGWAVVDNEGNVYESYSFVVADIFLDKEIMSSAYFIDKVPSYWEDIKKGTRELKTFKNIKKAFRECVKRNNIEIVMAHNARFDYRSLNLTLRYITNSRQRYFFPFGITVWDTLKMSREVLKDSPEYNIFCKENNFLTQRGCLRYTAEIIYRYLTNNLTFEESHTGLEDVLIEKEIFKFCTKIKPEIDGRLWKEATA